MSTPHLDFVELFQQIVHDLRVARDVGGHHFLVLRFCRDHALGIRAWVARAYTELDVGLNVSYIHTCIPHHMDIYISVHALGP